MILFHITQLLQVKKVKSSGILGGQDKQPVLPIHQFGKVSSM